MARVDLKGLHKVKRKVKGALLGTTAIRTHHYAWRGGPKFWIEPDHGPINTPEYLAALADCARRPKPAGLSTPELVDLYLDSADFRSLKPRTKADYRTWALRFSAAFKDDPAVMFQHPDSRGEVQSWREEWAHSPRAYDYAGQVASVILNWAQNAGKIAVHHCYRLGLIYKADRAEIIWTPEQIEALLAIAPEWVRRILITACETGLRPGDLVRLSRFHIKPTPKGRHVTIRTNKTGLSASIPVLPALAEVIDATPPGRELILVNDGGRKLTERAASDAVRYWRDKAGVSAELRLQDARGTAATKLFRAGIELARIAPFMGWSVRYAANIIERYARVDPNASDEILTRLSRERGAKAVNGDVNG